MKSRRIAALVALTAMLGAGASSLKSVDAACCYFAAKDKDINQPGQKAFINWNPQSKTESFTVQPKFEGNAIDFGMVIPTPTQPKLNEMPRDFFKDLAIYTILMPLPQPIYTMEDKMMRMRKMSMMGAAGKGGFPMAKRKSVTVLESGVVGSLDYKIIVADDAKGLFSWLKQHKYSYSGDQGTLDFYIKKKWFFTVMKIDPKQMKKKSDGSYLGEVTPTRFTFKSEKCVYPLKITQISVKDNTDALFYVQSPQQMDLEGDWSWMHSYRPMYLNYMLGCGINQEQQKEVMTRNSWLTKKMNIDRGFTTTKLEWAKKLGPAEISVCENPKANYAQMGVGDLPPGSKVVKLDYFLKEYRQSYLKNNKQIPKYVEDQIARMEDMYQPGKGVIVENDVSDKARRFNTTKIRFLSE